MFTDFCCPECGNTWSQLGDPPKPHDLDAFRCRECGALAEIERQETPVEIEIPIGARP
jgi:predicted RNA-binding Zn-ribbon protein involved in translation (DUF1610 family)